MRYRPALLQMLAALTWTATVTGAFTGYDDNLADYSGLDERIWFCMLGAAVVSSVPALLGVQVAGRIDRAYAAMAKVFITRPADPAPTPAPWPALRAVQHDGPRRQPGRHASR